MSTYPTVNDFDRSSPELVTRAGYRWPADKRIYPRVTRLLGVIDKPALLGWAARQAAECAIDETQAWQAMSDRSEQIKWIAAARTRTSSRAMTKGTDVHNDIPAFPAEQTHDQLADYCEQIQLKLRDSNDQTASYVNAAIEFVKHNIAQVRYQEITVFSDAGWAGTVDLIGTNYQDETVIVDWKTGKGLYAETALQLTAYEQADWIATKHRDTGEFTRTPMPGINELIAVRLTDRAKYETKHWRVTPANDAHEARIKAVEGCAAIRQWQHEHDQHDRSTDGQAT